MRRALVVCLALSLSTTMLGVFLLLRRMSLMGDAPVSYTHLDVYKRQPHGRYLGTPLHDGRQSAG